MDEDEQSWVQGWEQDNIHKSECKIKNKNRNIGDNEKGKCEDKDTQERAGGHQRWGKGNGACMSKGEDKGK